MICINIRNSTKLFRIYFRITVRFFSISLITKYLSAYRFENICLALARESWHVLAKLSNPTSSVRMNIFSNTSTGNECKLSILFVFTESVDGCAISITPRNHFTWARIWTASCHNIFTCQKWKKETDFVDIWFVFFCIHTVFVRFIVTKHLNNSEIDMDASTSTSLSDSGVGTLTKRRKLDEKNTQQAIIDTMCNEVGKFAGVVSRITM